MPREKIKRFVDGRRIVYDGEHWKLFREMRSHAVDIMKNIPYPSSIYGSLARGDVTTKSDIDIVLLEPVPSYLIEMNINYWERWIIQATPNSAIKAVYIIDEKTALSVPLVPLTDTERQFYDFGGRIGPNLDTRVCGVNKKLLFIEPTEDGHVEWSILGREYEAAKKLHIDVNVVEERIRVLSRRDKIGRTGMYLKTCVPERYGVEEFVRILCDRDPVIRRVVRER